MTQGREQLDGATGETLKDHESRGEGRRLQTELRRQGDMVASTAQKTSQRALRLPEPVQRRGIEMSYTARKCSSEHVLPAARTADSHEATSPKTDAECGLADESQRDGRCGGPRCRRTCSYRRAHTGNPRRRRSNSAPLHAIMYS